MDKKQKTIIIAIFSILFICLLIAIVLFVRERENKSDMQQLFELEKEEMSNDYISYAKQYDELQEIISNDSLKNLLDQEKMRVQRLLEELQEVKTSDAAEIMRLKKELATVRAVMRSYVMQIDSLGRLNKQLDAENTELRAKNREVSSRVSTLTQEKERLTEKVSIASKLNASGIVVSANNKRGKRARRIKDVVNLVVSFSIDRNQSAEVGEKTIYVRILKPDKSVLKKAGASTFAYENTQLEYSMRKVIEFGGDSTPVTMYWNVDEYLFEGEYQLDIFADGALIGTTHFRL